MRPIIMMSLGLVFIIAAIGFGFVGSMEESALYAPGSPAIEPLTRLEIPPESDSGLPWNEWLMLGLAAAGAGISGTGLVLQFKTFRR